MELTHKRIAMFIEDQFEDLEFWYPYYRFLEAGAEVTVFGSGKKEYHGKRGLSAQEDFNINKADPSEFDALVIPGGHAPDSMRVNQAMIEFVQSINQDKKTLAAICHAGWVLASAGILKGRKVTSYPTIRMDLENAGAQWVDISVVIDDNLITSREPSDLPAFCPAIINTLG